VKRAAVSIIAALALMLVANVAPASAYKTCSESSEGILTAQHVSCGIARAVANHAAPHIGRGQHHFHLYVRGVWICTFASVAGHPTLACERARALVAIILK